MNTRKIIIFSALLMLAVGLMPLTAQNSPAGALATNHVFNRDMDIFMMPNFAPFVNYQRFFSFVQGSRLGSGLPGFSAGYATNVRGTFMHFFLDTNGFSLNNVTTETDSGTLENRATNFDLQFDTLIGTADIGAFKLGLQFSNVGQQTVETATSRQTTRSGFFTTSLTYGRNFINDDFSMILAGGSVRFRLPMFEDTLRTTSGGITTTRTRTMRDTGDLHLQFPGVFPDTSMRLEIEPHLYWFFRPRLEPMVVISHIFLQNTLILQFFPEETERVQQTGSMDAWTRQDRRYIGNTLFGYFNRLYVITPRFSVAWRVNFTLGFFHNYEGSIRTRDHDGTETVSRVGGEALFLAAVIAPRLAFSYQIIPATLTFNGALVLNQLGPMNAIGWQHYRITRNYDNGDVRTRTENLFNPIQPFITIGAAWYLSPHLVLESGINVRLTETTPPAVIPGGPGRHLDEITLAIVYRR